VHALEPNIMCPKLLEELIAALADNKGSGGQEHAPCDTSDELLRVKPVAQWWFRDLHEQL
jgi:hypothetical protein